MIELKTWPSEFVPIWEGASMHTIRRFDRAFVVGNRVTLREWDPRREVNSRYTGRSCVAVITHISGPGTFGLPEQLGVLALVVLERRSSDALSYVLR